MRTHHPIRRRAALSAAATLLALAATVPGLASPPPLVSNRHTSVSEDELRTEINRTVPRDKQAAWAANPRNITQTLEALVLYKSLAANAHAAKLQDDPEIARELQASRDRILARAYLEKVAADTRFPDFEKRAKELYALYPERYTTASRYDTSHILFSNTCRGGIAAAMERAKRVAGALAQGGNFDALILENSDDPAVEKNKGHLGLAKIGDLAEEYSAAIKTMKPGQISAPIVTQFGVHLIRLNAIEPGVLQPYELVKPQIVADLREKHLASEREKITGPIRNDPEMKIDEALIRRVQAHYPLVRPGG
jgi:hypothetical protein